MRKYSMSVDEALRILRLRELRPGDIAITVVLGVVLAIRGEAYLVIFTFLGGWFVNLGWKAWLKRKVRLARVKA